VEARNYRISSHTNPRLLLEQYCQTLACIRDPASTSNIKFTDEHIFKTPSLKVQLFRFFELSDAITNHVLLALRYSSLYAG